MLSTSYCLCNILFDELNDKIIRLMAAVVSQLLSNEGSLSQ